MEARDDAKAILCVFLFVKIKIVNSFKMGGPIIILFFSSWLIWIKQRYNTRLVMLIKIYTFRTLEDKLQQPSYDMSFYPPVLVTNEKINQHGNEEKKKETFNTRC